MIIQCHGCNPREMIQSTLAVISALFIMIIISFFHPFLLIFIHGIFYKSIWAFFLGVGQSMSWVCCSLATSECDVRGSRILVTMDVVNYVVMILTSPTSLRLHQRFISFHFGFHMEIWQRLGCHHLRLLPLWWWVITPRSGIPHITDTPT